MRPRYSSTTPWVPNSKPPTLLQVAPEPSPSGVCFNTRTTGGSKPLRERNREESILLALKALDTAAEADTATGGVDRHGKIFPIIKIVTGAGVETVADDKLSELFQTQVA